MFLKGLRTLKTSRTQVTLVVEVAVMAFNMQPHFTVVTETFSADVAFERGFARVKPYMNFVPRKTKL